MLQYHLLGQAIVFEDAAERYFDLQFAAEQAAFDVSRQFKDWYTKCGNIQSILNGYPQFSESVIEKLAFRPLFGQLAQCEIYDMSEESYWKRCIGTGESESALETVEQQYNAILKRQNAEKEYRADRKANRSRWHGCGLGISGALKGAAKAASLNAVSGLGHSAFNAIGNAGSALSASMDKSALYKNPATSDILLNGIIADLFTAYFAHMDFLNERKGNYVKSVFDVEKSSALFENAKKLPEKERELLIRAFTLCPWNDALIKYIFIHFPEDRKTICSAAQRFSVDLRDSVEDILAQEYDSAAQSSEVNAQAAKKRILNHMKEYGFSESATLDRLETDCLLRICDGYQSADEAACEQLIEKVRQYQAQEKVKGPFFEQLHKRIEAIWLNELTQICLGYEMADEAACEKFLAEIKAHKAPDSLKASFMQKVQARIESIWSAEDGEIFDNLYMKTDITDPKAVAEALAYVQSKGRTGSSQQYVDALNACTSENIRIARLFHNTSYYKIYILLAILCAAPVITLPLTVFFFVKAWRMKQAWKLLTLNKTMIHPALLSVHSNTK